MNKDLKNMSLEELWELFPIVLSPHNLLWAEWADEEISLLSSLLQQFKPFINHIGSTAIPDIMAKPIIDILVEIPPDTDLSKLCLLMESNGYLCMSATDGRMSFNKGYTPEGFADRVFHIHFHKYGDKDEILFRNHLIAHPEIAKEYEKLKLDLLPRFKHDRDGYTDAKSSFITRITAMAMREKPIP